MTDYKAMIEEHSCKPNQGCGVMTICMCGVAEDMADEIERLRDVLHRLAELDEFACGKPQTIEEVMNYTQFVARAALAGG